MEESGISPWLWAIIAAALAYLTASPGVLQGFWDTYIYAPFLGVTQPQLKRGDIRMGAKLAEGGFGQVFLAEAKADVPGRVRKGEVRVAGACTLMHAPAEHGSRARSGPAHRGISGFRIVRSLLAAACTMRPAAVVPI